MKTAIAGNLGLRCCLILSAWSGAAGGGEPLVPLTELGTVTYRGEAGGLYGEGSNEPPPVHRERAKRALPKIQPLDAGGRPSANGQIVLLSIGMSNTTQEFSAFIHLANADRRKRPELVLVDGAQGGADAATWAGTRGHSGRQAGQGADPWSTVEKRLQVAGVTPAQVQAAWIKQALAGPAAFGEFSGHVDALEDALTMITRKASERFPNLRVVFFSSRIYGGYATSRLNPEPYAYEGAFAVRSVIRRQIDTETKANVDENRSESASPILLWGPYLWADGENSRADGLSWRPEDFREDGTHPSNLGRRKVAGQLLKFFTNDEFGREVFMR